MFEFQVTSNMFKQMLGHYEYIWKYLSRDPEMNKPKGKKQSQKGLKNEGVKKTKNNIIH